MVGNKNVGGAVEAIVAYFVLRYCWYLLGYLWDFPGAAMR